MIIHPYVATHLAQLFQAAWEHCSDAMVLSDPNGTVIAANPAYLRLHGYQAEEIIGQNFTVIYPPEAREQARQRYTEIFQSGIVQPSYESTLQRKDGRTHYVEALAHFIYEHGQPIAMLSITRDITDRKALEQAYGELLTREQNALAEAQRAIGVRDNFLSIASHELRGQLTIVSGNAQLLYRRLSGRELAPAEAQLLTLLTDQTTHLTEVINDLFDLSLIEQGRIALNAMELDLGLMLAQIVAHMSPTMTQHRLAYHGPDQPIAVEGDPMRLEQVFQNLIQNAVKYSPQGGTIVLHLARQEGWAVITISDHGIGIPETALPNLFNQFFRAPNSQQQDIKGSGIGLYIVKEIITLHKGSIRATSVEGQGSTFTIELPLMAAGDQAQ